MMGRITSSSILAKLIMMYFSPKFSSMATGFSSSSTVSAESVLKLASEQLDVDLEDATSVGSPVRLQQMFCIFFEAYGKLGPNAGTCA